jgi:hypothetical protein
VPYVRYCLKAGLEKTRFIFRKNPVFFKKNQPSGFFWVFGVFLGFFCPDERVFRVFSVSQTLLGASRL